MAAPLGWITALDGMPTVLAVLSSLPAGAVDGWLLGRHQRA